jgi:hypothetical protein
MTKDRIEARLIGRVLDRETRELVGWLLKWNTGELGHLWKDDIYEDVDYEFPVRPHEFREHAWPEQPTG